MKSLKFIIAIPFALCLGSCNSTSQQSVEVSQEDEEETANGILSLRFGEPETVIHRMGGRKYSCTVSIATDETLPIVVNPMDYQYYDNKATLVITSSGNTILRKDFTKKSFSDLIPAKELKSSALIGFCYNYEKENDPSGIYFIATVGNPDISSDQSQSFELKVTGDGTVSISKMEIEGMTRNSKLETIDPEFDADMELSAKSDADARTESSDD